MIKGSKKKFAINLLNFSDEKVVGIGVFMKNLLESTLEKMVIDYKLQFYCSDTIDPYRFFGIPKDEGIEVRRVESSNVIVRILYEQFVLPFKLRDADVYFSPSPVLPFLLKLVNPRCRCIITIHDMIPFFVRNKYGKIRGHYVRILSKYGARLTDEIITVSENSKKDIVLIAGVNPDKISVVYNSIPQDRVTSDIGHRNYFLSISTIEPGKNIEQTMEAFSLFRKVNSDFKFYWIGKLGWGYSWEQLHDMISTLNLKDHFILTGYVSGEEKDKLLTECTAIVYLSHYEGFGLPVLEGMACGKPAVTSNNSSLPEVVGEAGITCDTTSSGDIAEALLDIATNRQKYVLAIPSQLAKFDAYHQSRKFLNIIAGHKINIRDY